MPTAAPAQAAQSAYVTDGNNVFQFEIVAGGLLVPMTPAEVAAGESPTSMAVSPDFESLYAANEDSDSVSQYDIGRDGALSPKSPATVATGGDPHGVAVSPDGQSVYVTSVSDHHVAQFDVGAGGELSPKSPATVAVDPGPRGIGLTGVAVTPDGQSVYVTDEANFDIWQFDVGTGGTLSLKSPPTVFAGYHEFPSGVTVSPDGQSIYVTNLYTTNKYADVGVSQFDVGSGGALSLKSPATVAAGFGPTGGGGEPGRRERLRQQPSWVLSSGPGEEYGANVSQYHVGAGGLLSPMDPAKVAAGEGAHGGRSEPGRRKRLRRKQRQ